MPNLEAISGSFVISTEAKRISEFSSNNSFATFSNSGFVTRQFSHHGTSLKLK